MKTVKHMLFKIKNPKTGEYESIPALRGESAYEAAVRLGYTTLTEEQWVKEYDTKRDQAIAAIESKRESAIADADAAIDDIEAKGIETLNSIPEDYTTLTEQVNQNTADILTKAPAIVEEASGPIVTVTDAAAQPAVQLVTHIEPVQEGEGDPSPDNVRPISGLSSIFAARTSKNLFDGVWEPGGININGTEEGSSASVNRRFANYIPVRPGSKVAVSRVITNNMKIRFYDKNKTYVGAGGYGGSSSRVQIYTIPSDAYFIRLTIDSISDAEIKLQIEYGETATEYEPGNISEILTADLPETVYGGTLDWGTGVFVSTLDADGNALEEPQLFQLTPQQLDMLKGTNNVWSDCGDTSVVYVADTRMYIDNKFAELQNAILAHGANI